MLGLITRRRHNAEMSAVRSYNDALRERCETAEENERAERVARRTITRQHAELDAANRRLDGRNRELTRRLEDTTEGVYVTQLETRLQKLAHGTSRWMLAVWSRDRRINILQQQLGATRTNLVGAQARVAELHEQLRKAEAAADPRPPEGGARYPGRRDELRAARDHAAALDRRLSDVTEANANCKCGAA
ncbi:hypothetical protein [Streptomyces sp. ME01-18h]|uniref:hypothetical protein n=1 Tax=Streptomyces sp. ME01-18h TaxID=462920 RepID=UPI0029BC7EDC|nr:hypothetical protein [Streptomyces sp. ME01-18h]MDX3398398.1 hypothetical protein [Streptomyces sp. ME01-18h]